MVGVASITFVAGYECYVFEKITISSCRKHRNKMLSARIVIGKSAIASDLKAAGVEHGTARSDASNKKRRTIKCLLQALPRKKLKSVVDAKMCILSTQTGPKHHHYTSSFTVQKTYFCIIRFPIKISAAQSVAVAELQKIRLRLWGRIMIEPFTLHPAKCHGQYQIYPSLPGRTSSIIVNTT